MLEDVGNPLGIFLIRFLSPNRLDILGMDQNNGAGVFQNVVNRYPIFPGGLHTDILAMVFSQPSNAPPQFIGKCGKALALVGCNAMIIGCGNTRHNKTFVNIHPTTDGVNNFEHNTSPRNSI